MKKNRNAGFSLVELIIVIAVMAVLVAVVAAQFLKYVERARNAVDVQNATAIVEALQVYFADPEHNLSDFSGGIKNVFFVGEYGTGYIDDGSGDTARKKRIIKDALISAGLEYTPDPDDPDAPYFDITCKSRHKWIEYSITFGLTEGGELSIEYSALGPGDEDTEAKKNFQNAMRGAK